MALVAQFVPVLAECTHHIPVTEATRNAVRAIADSDAATLCEAVASAPLAPESIVAIALQAWRTDVANGTVGVRMRFGGLTAAVFMGATKRQIDDGTCNQGDNSVTLMCDLAVRVDDPRVIDTLFDWEPGFRMGRADTGKCDVDTTTEYFLESGATRCAARMLELKAELEQSTRGFYTRDALLARALREATRMLHGGQISDELCRKALDSVAEAKGEPTVVNHVGSGRVFTIGLALIGKSELMVDYETGTGRVDESRMISTLKRVLMGHSAPPGRAITFKRDNCLFKWVEATSYLRDDETPPYRLIH
jgi:hypothetical protein